MVRISSVFLAVVLSLSLMVTVVDGKSKSKRKRDKEAATQPSRFGETPKVKVGMHRDDAQREIDETGWRIKPYNETETEKWFHLYGPVEHGPRANNDPRMTVIFDLQTWKIIQIIRQ